MPALGSVVGGCLAAVALAACGAQAMSAPVHSAGAPDPATVAAPRATRPKATAKAIAPKATAPSYPSLLAAATSSAPSGFAPAMRWRGGTAAYIAQSPSGVGLLSFDQRLTELRLHSGTVDAGATGWHWGPEVSSAERPRLIAAFNGGFQFSTGAGGFESYGRVARPLTPGLGSIVTYADGRTDIGSLRSEVPAAGTAVASVRQNLTLLIDGGSAASNIDCRSCWGATLGAVPDPARSALGITAHGNLVWAGGEHVTVAELADALLGAGVVRAVELDINPQWVAGYLYGHRAGAGAGAPTPVPVVPGQVGVAGFYLTPSSRDFFTVAAR